MPRRFAQQNLGFHPSHLGFVLENPNRRPYIWLMNNDALSLIRARRAEIKAERGRLDAEDVELDIAEKAISRLAAAHPVASPIWTVPTPPKTQKEFVLHTLKSSPNAWFENIHELRDAVEKYGKDIPITSFQPLISTMTNEDKLLVRDGSRIALATRAAYEGAK